MSGITPSQTVGPFFAYGLTPNGKYPWNDAFGTNLITPDASGERIRIEGRVYDGDGKPIPDAMIEIWQADAAGRYAHPADRRALPNASFKGFGRAGTDQDGALRLRDDQARARCRARMASRRRRTSWLRSMPAACCGKAIRASISPTRPPMPTIPSSRSCRRSAAHPDRQARPPRRQAGLQLGHPDAGRPRNGVLRGVIPCGRASIPANKPAKEGQPPCRFVVVS